MTYGRKDKLGIIRRIGPDGKAVNRALIVSDIQDAELVFEDKGGEYAVNARQLTVNGGKIVYTDGEHVWRQDANGDLYHDLEAYFVDLYI